MRETESEHDHARLQRLAATASLAVAVLLTLLKLAAAMLTGSLALLSSMADSLTDIIASSVTYFSVRISQHPPDLGHRFGHGKAEALSALAQSAIVMGAAILILAEAVHRLLAPRPIQAPGFGILVMLVSMIVTLLLLAFQKRVIRLTGSQAIEADAMHYRADLLTTLVILVALSVGGRAGWAWLDPVAAVVVAGYIAWNGLRIGIHAVDTLMDHELPAEIRARIAAIVHSHPEVRGMHDLRTRRSGRTLFIEMHVELDPQLTVARAHDIADALESRIRREFPDAEVLLHQEPAGIEDARLDHRLRSPPGSTQT